MHAGHGQGGRFRENFDDDKRQRTYRRATVFRVLHLYGPYRARLILVLLLVLVTAGLGIVTPLLIRQVIDDAIPSGDRGQLAWLVGTMIAAAGVSGAFNLVQAYVNTGVGLRVMRDLRRALYHHLQKLSLSFFTSNRTGDIQSRMANDVASTELVLTDTLSTIVSNVAIVLSSVIAMLIISPQLSLVALVTVPVFVFFTVRVGRKRRRLTRDTQRALAELTARTGETLSVSGVLLAKTFGREQEQMARFEADNDRLTELSIRRQLTGRGFFVVVQTFFTMAPALVWLLGGFLITREGDPTVTIGDIVAFTTIQVRLLFPLSGLLSRGVDITSSLALFDRIFEYMDLEPAVKDPENPAPVDLRAVRGQISFSDVRFEYPLDERSQRDADQDSGAIAMRSEDRNGLFKLGPVAFDSPAGTLTALVGPSGSGKTTVGYLLTRLYDVDGGSVRIDGRDIRDVKQEDLAKMIGVVSQDPFLFHTSIAENMRYGKPDATDNELVEAATAAQIHDTIVAMPEGYDTIVGERGYRLSGGERQRVAIARVILKNPRILLLDEATSSLDTMSERLIQQALSKLMENRTTIAIAHRLSTVIAARQILVIHEGKVVERGTHRDLLGASELYRRLYEEQFTTIPAVSAAG